ncbi:MAG TPA: putative lipopolysaccharide heptosyltransferase III [Casimicrobiaceae bacterium]|jgi:heptosyltransferase-3
MPSPLPDPVDLGLVHRALVTKLRHHGDVLLASPVFTVLGHAAPAAEIDALVYAETAPMLAGHPAISRLHAIDRNWKREGFFRQARAEGALLSALRERRYDLIVHLTEHPRGAWLSRLLRPRYSVARHLDRAHWLWRTSFTHYYRLPRRTPRHTVECNLDSLRRIGVQPEPADKALVLAPDRAASERVRSLLAQRGIGPKRFIQVHPGSRWMFKCWSAERYTALIEQLAAGGWQVVLTAAPDVRERALLDAIRGATDEPARSRVSDLGGQLSLTELAALTRDARAFVGVDSAPMHIAAAVGTPVVALFGPSGEVEWGPWQVPHRIVSSSEHPCRPCGNDGCGGGKISECLTTLPVARVYAALTALLDETGG